MKCTDGVRVDEGIRSEDAGTFGCLLQGDADVVTAAYINVLVRGRRFFVTC